MNHWTLGETGRRFHNDKGVVREITGLANNNGPASKRKVEWKRIRGTGPDTGSMLWPSWLRWVKGEWLQPRPVRLPVPIVLDVELAFPTAQHVPPWHWVPDDFKGKWNPWTVLADKLFAGHPPATQWNGVPREGVDAEMAFRAVQETQGSYRLKHQVKIASMAYMLSEWFKDFWWDGDTHTRIDNLEVPELP